MNRDSNSNYDQAAEDALRAALCRVMRSRENHDSLDQNDLASIAENGLRGLDPEIRDKLISQLLSDPDQLESVVNLYNFVQTQSHSSAHNLSIHTDRGSKPSAFTWLKPVFALAASVAVLSASGLVMELTRGRDAPGPNGVGPHMSDAVDSANSTAQGSIDLTLVFSIVCALSLSVAVAALIVLLRRAKRSRLVQHHEPGVGSEPG